MTDRDYEFRMTLSHDEVRCEYDRPGEDECDLGKASIHRDEHMETIELLEDWLKRWDWIALWDDERLLVPDTFRVLGNHLWRMALRDIPGRRLIQAIQEVRRSPLRPRPTVRVRMSFADDAGDLAALPWEFVHLADDESFLAAETSLTLGRYVDGEGFHDADFLSADNKLRVLFVVSLPDGEEYDDERKAMQTLADELGQLVGQNGGLNAPSRMQVLLYEGWDHAQVVAKLAEFRDAPDGGPVDVVHLTALFKIVGEPQIRLPNPKGRWRWTNALPVVHALTADPDNRPKLVILHLCDWHETHSGSAPEDFEPLAPEHAPEHFEQLAPEFIRKEIPAVLAMQYPMRPVDGCDFVKRLYRRLADGENIGAAVQATRSDLVHRRNRYFGTPVLYMQSRVDGGLVTRVARGEDSETRAGRDRPSAQKPATEPPGAYELGDELIRVVKELPKTTTTNDLAEWINEQGWPASVTDPADQKKAETIIRLRRRQLNDNQEADDILRQLLGRVAELAHKGGGR